MWLEEVKCQWQLRKQPLLSGAFGLFNYTAEEMRMVVLHNIDPRLLYTT